jgi:hypothetical protein
MLLIYLIVIFQNNINLKLEQDVWVRVLNECFNLIAIICTLLVIIEQIVYYPELTDILFCIELMFFTIYASSIYKLYVKLFFSRNFKNELYHLVQHIYFH